ncbi:MAG TPA: hypothetical protein VKV23_03165 [Acidimicrobiales bacterium]|nr:hypothetical protein [Acidimicrobiales bacterium]
MATYLEGISFGATIRVEPLVDAVVDGLGHDPRSDYVARFWLPVLGPSTTWFLRLMASHLDGRPEGVVLDVAETARALGLGERSGRHGPFLRTVARAVDFSMAAPRGAGRLAVRRRLPPLARRHVARLPAALREEHERLAAAAAAASPADALRRRGERLALSLLELGEAPEETERQLLRWRFPASLARQCVGLAASVLAQRAGAPACRAPSPSAAGR